MTQPKSLAINVPLFPALSMALLCLGAAVHGNPTLLRPILTLAGVLPHVR